MKSKIKTLIVDYLLRILFDNTRFYATNQSCDMYVMTYNKHFNIALASIISINYFLHIIPYVVSDGSLTPSQINMLKSKIPADHILEESMLSILIDKKYLLLNKWYQNYWQGKKFLIPLLHKKEGKCIVIDSDTLFLAKPYTLIKWLYTNTKYGLYISDYMNFVNISIFEAEKYFNLPIHHFRMNTGLLCIDRTIYWKNNSLTDIESLLENILDLISQRITRDYYRREEYYHSLFLLDQTLFWLTLNKIPMRRLPSSYCLLYPPDVHKKSPQFIHFTPDSSNKNILYGFLFYCILNFVKNQAFRTRTYIPWFLTVNFSNYQQTLVNKGVLRNKMTSVLDFFDVTMN